MTKKRLETLIMMWNGISEIVDRLKKNGIMHLNVTPDMNDDTAHQLFKVTPVEISDATQYLLTIISLAYHQPNQTIADIKKGAT